MSIARRRGRAAGWCCPARCSERVRANGGRCSCRAVPVKAPIGFATVNGARAFACPETGPRGGYKFGRCHARRPLPNRPMAGIQCHFAGQVWGPKSDLINGGLWRVTVLFLFVSLGLCPFQLVWARGRFVSAWAKSLLARCFLVEALVAPGRLTTATRAGPLGGQTVPPLRPPGAQDADAMAPAWRKWWARFEVRFGGRNPYQNLSSRMRTSRGTRVPPTELLLHKALHKIAI